MSKRNQDAIKIVLIGDSCVGKTSIMTQYIESNFQNAYLTTIGVDFHVKNPEYKNVNVPINIWDTSGLDRFSTITSSYLRKIDAVVVVFSKDYEQSFLNIDK